MNFCTLFDSSYLSKGIALYLSLERVSSDFHLYVMAFDLACYEKLNSIGFQNMTIDLWDEWETPEIKATKEDRTRAEYCWTCGPTVIYHFLIHYQLSDITYLDSDLFFMGDPQIAFDEIGSASIAITEQGISQEAEKMFGKYCVQFMYFKNNADGNKVLEYWRLKCEEWCYNRMEDGKWPEKSGCIFYDKDNQLIKLKDTTIAVASYWPQKYYEPMRDVCRKLGYTMQD